MSLPLLKFDISKCSDHLEEIRPGVWGVKGVTKYLVSYPEENHDLQKEYQESSFWYLHRNSCLSKIFERYPVSEIIDIGGSNGAFSNFFGTKMRVILLEPGEKGVAQAERSGISPIIHASLEEAKFKDGCMPAVGLFDVLEHIEKDDKFVEELSRIMTNDGYVFLTVPAFKFLWSSFDESVGHFRRYNLRRITKLLEKHGFRIEYSSYLFYFLPLPMYLLRKLRASSNKTKTHKFDHAHNKSFFGRVLIFLLQIEVWAVGKNITIPFGSSCILVAKRTNYGK